MKRPLISTVLLAAQLAAIASCGGSNTDVDTTKADTTTALPSDMEITRANYPDTVPTDLDFGGETLTIISRNDNTLYLSEFTAEEENGDILNDAIYNRNRYVEERLNVKLETLLAPGGWADHTSFMGLITSSAMAADGAIDIVPYYAFLQPSLAAQGIYIDFHSDDIQYINLEQPWWYQDLVEQGTINGKLYFITGDIAISSIAMMAAIAFNQNLATEYLKDVDLYQLVRDGKWTFDVMLGYAQDVYHDVNGNTVADAADIFGFDGGRSDQFIHSANVAISKQVDGERVLVLNNERMTTLVEKMQSFYKTPGYLPSTIKFETSAFPAGHVLFSNRYVRDIAALREMEDDYGVLPLPKLDEAQEQYKTTLGDSYSQVAILVSSDNIPAADAAVELLAAQSYRSVTDVYYENVLKVKYARDENTAEILDIVRAGIEVDFCELFADLANSPVGKMRNVLQETSAEFSSTYASIEATTNQKIKEIYTTFE